MSRIIRHSMTRFMLLSRCLLCLLVCGSSGQKIAIIGGAVSGSFSAKYLSDYDVGCKLESITVFDPIPADKPVTKDTLLDADWQGSRVASFKRSDGSIVELGASVAYKGFHLVTEMMRNDPSLEAGTPFATGKRDEHLREGFGIFNGFGNWPLVTSLYSKFFRKFQILGRYNTDLFKVTKVCQQSQAAFATIPSLMESKSPDTFYESPDALWRAIGVEQYVYNSFDSLLDAIGVYKEPSWWRSYLPFQGSLREELLTAINLVNYNQDNEHVNGLVGLGSFAPASGGLFSIVGGNYKIIESALGQAMFIREKTCQGNQTINRVEKRVTTVLGKIDGFVLYAGDEVIGDFDIVILAAPLQQSRIKFLIQSHMDEAVIQPMPLGGMVNPENEPSDDGHLVLPPKLPDSAVRSYTQVVTTVVSNATLNTTYLQIKESYLPRSVMSTKKGKASLHNITAITQVSSSGIYKMFSDDELSEDTLKILFGGEMKVDFVKVWGGRFGGATPDYRGGGEATRFLLYDVAGSLDGEADDTGALYYSSALEQSTLACMEMSAIGSRAVAKLVAKRLGLIEAIETMPGRDEL